MMRCSPSKAPGRVLRYQGAGTGKIKTVGMLIRQNKAKLAEGEKSCK
jgi:hypothetical protein